MFNRAHHRRVAAVLQALDADLLRTHRCYFGGGTAIVLRRGEYRESADIDFLVSDINGYRELRQLVTGADGINGLTLRPLTQLRDIRADRYGIRTHLEVDGSPLKFEVIHEGRITVDTPALDDHVCGVTTLGTEDMAASKLLANADRWADRSAFSRDLIDLAMLAPSSETLHTAISKAAYAYGSSIVSCLTAAIDNLCGDPKRLDDCTRALRILETPKAVLWQKITDLRPESAD